MRRRGASSAAGKDRGIRATRGRDDREPDAGSLGLREPVTGLPVEIILGDIEQHLGGAIGIERLVAEVFSAIVHVRVDRIQNRRLPDIEIFLLGMFIGPRRAGAHPNTESAINGR